MPELPEVETVARGLQEELPGRTITRVEVLWDRSIATPAPQAFVERLQRQRIACVGRRGKWVRIQLESGDVLLVHLRMTGRLLVEQTGAEEDPYTRVLLVLDDGRELRFSNPRKFGRMALVADADEVVGDLGPEPLADDFTAQRLAEMLSGRRGRLKPLLLKQRFLAGLGNIYADEVLWRARLHPLRTAGTLSAGEVARLHAAIRTVLGEAIAWRGTTLEDQRYVGPDGVPGEFAARLAAYGREGEPCLCCGTPMERIVVGQRGTCFCPRCQPLES
jgi:formamidopyrimidine-DNA glycosylase